MSAHVSGFVVTLNIDMHGDDAKELAAAIAHMKHVVSVVAVENDSVLMVARESARCELINKLWDVLHPKGG